MSRAAAAKRKKKAAKKDPPKPKLVEDVPEEKPERNFQMTIKPIRDMIIVEPAEKIKKIGSIIIPDNQQKRECQGIVIAAGPGLWIDDGTKKGSRKKMDVKQRDLVSYNEYAGVDFMFGKVELLVMRESDINYVLEQIEVDENGVPLPGEIPEEEKAEEETDVKDD